MTKKIISLLAVLTLCLFFVTACGKKTDMHSGHDEGMEQMDQNGAAMSMSGDYMKQTYDTPELKIGDKAICPVMGSQFDVTKDSLVVEIKGKKYYVCCPDCPEKLKADPDKYLK